MKYVVVTGGVVSGLGKGISISSIGVLLKAAGLRVTAIKIDPYLNSDAGTMSPFEHGEVFVLNDGGEVSVPPCAALAAFDARAVVGARGPPVQTVVSLARSLALTLARPPVQPRAQADLDLGNYERFLNVTLTRDHNLTTGKVYSKVIDAERRGDYLGKTVQVIPHVTDAVQVWIDRVARLAVDAGAEQGSPPPDVCLIEVGGTVGDIESLVFLEALRQFQWKVRALSTAPSSPPQSDAGTCGAAARTRSFLTYSFALLFPLSPPTSLRAGWAE